MALSMGEKRVYLRKPTSLRNEYLFCSSACKHPEALSLDIPLYCRLGCQKWKQSCRINFCFSLHVGFGTECIMDIFFGDWNEQSPRTSSIWFWVSAMRGLSWILAKIPLEDISDLVFWRFFFLPWIWVVFNSRGSE